LLDNLMGFRRERQMLEAWVIREGLGDDTEQVVEWCEVAGFGRIDRLLHAMIARDEGGVRSAHISLVFVRASRLGVQLSAPAFRPVVKRRGVIESRTGLAQGLGTRQVRI
jgi:hypothetical protein